ncbi:hypothetical protein O181_104999 [Austropuccinia psidii MF-1]|uniref:Uncharacterized protein n=1 Tax=Austropuccinia psidii MF-1 TaxID=1389203 RepID=A0A9Q3JPC2_9BASI|nr:hypothetical protein [Austropuccinia psidii MF-1]
MQQGKSCVNHWQLSSRQAYVKQDKSQANVKKQSSECQAHCHNHGNSPPWIPIWHIKSQFFYGQLAISITSGQYGHVIILWTIYGHLCFGAFMALHLNPETIASVYAQMGISGHFPQDQGKWPKWLFLAIWAHNAHLRIFAHFAHFCAL